MKFIVEKFLNHWTLLAINIIIVVAVELSDNFFTQTGLIHLVAVIFVFLGLIRLWSHTHVHDKYLEPIIHRGIFALLILALSHVVEFASFRYFRLPRQTIYANVINFYMAGLLIINLGVEGFLRKLRPDSKLIVPISWLAIFSFFSLIVIFFFNSSLIDLSPGSWHIYAYLFVIIVVAVMSISRLLILKSHVKIMVNFISYFVAAIISISLCGIISASEEVIIGWGLPSIQIAFINHFLFYGALSLVFLAYERLLHLGGVYADLDGLQQQKTPL